MRKYIAVLVAICLILPVFAGCSSKEEQFTAEDFVTLEQLNTDGKYVARGFFESIYTYDENMFEQCFPDGYVKALGDAAGGNVFEQYKNTMNLGGTFMGSASAGFKDCTVENGFDVATMRSKICFATGFEYSEVGQIQIQKIQNRKVFISHTENIHLSAVFFNHKNLTKQKVFRDSLIFLLIPNQHYPFC